MDQVKIGRFIADCRKNMHLTQAQLAEKLGITDRAVSKWETGKAMPDSSLMLPLCDVLNISVNDLLSGEVVTMEKYNKELENHLLEAVREKEKADKRLLAIEIVLGVLASIILFTMVMFASFANIDDWLRVVLIVAGFVLFLVAISFAILIEQTAGYYKCGKCGHRYVPDYMRVFMAPHVNRTRYMRCPKCNEKSWQKKVLTKE